MSTDDVVEVKLHINILNKIVIMFGIGLNFYLKASIQSPDPTLSEGFLTSPTVFLSYCRSEFQATAMGSMYPFPGKDDLTVVHFAHLPLDIHNLVIEMLSPSDIIALRKVWRPSVIFLS